MMISISKIKCDYCQVEFERETKFVTRNKKINNNSYCSRKCTVNSKKTRVNVVCKQCGKTFEKMQKEIKKSPNHFCSCSCAVTYNNTHKKHGVRRSKLEKYLEEQLTILYPNLQIIYNSKEAINSELDIYIPSLRLAFELNGIFHYEPIYGQEKLNQIKTNDQNKFQLCIVNNISLCIIDVSSQKYFKESTSKKYLDIICDIVDNKLQ